MTEPFKPEYRDGCLVYPLPLDASLSGFGWHTFHGERFLRSDTLTRALSDAKLQRARMEGLGFATILWSQAFSEAPCGTLPDDDIALTQAAKLGRDQKAWWRVKEEALRGFGPLVTPEGKPIHGRIGHAVLVEVAVDTWHRAEKWRADQAASRRRTARKTLRGLARSHLPKIAEHLRDTPTCDLYLDCLDHHGMRITEGDVAEVHMMVFSGWRKPESAEVIALKKHG